MVVQGCRHLVQQRRFLVNPGRARVRRTMPSFPVLCVHEKRTCPAGESLNATRQ